MRFWIIYFRSKFRFYFLLGRFSQCNFKIFCRQPTMVADVFTPSPPMPPSTETHHHPPSANIYPPPPTISQNISTTTHHHLPPAKMYPPPPTTTTTTQNMGHHSSEAKIYSYITSFWHCFNSFFFFEMQYSFLWQRFCVIKFW